MRRRGAGGRKARRARRKVERRHGPRAIDTDDFEAYKLGIIHDWLRTLTLLAASSCHCSSSWTSCWCPRRCCYASGRIASSRWPWPWSSYDRAAHNPSRWSYVHGYVMSVQVGGFIALMTVALGGFDSSYYAGLNLVIIGVNLLMPWKVIHSAINAALILAMYVLFNAVAGLTSHLNIVANNLFFLCATGILAVSINYVRYRLIQKEFSLLVTLKQARDALWGEMELAKRIQTALLPQNQQRCEDSRPPWQCCPRGR